MTLDPQAAAVLAAAPAGPPLSALGPAGARAAYQAVVRARAGAGWDPGPVGAVRDEVVAGVACRRYLPVGEPVGSLVWLHGGGWVVGDLDSHDPLCRALAARAGLTVLAVDYRRAPEHPCPAALQDGAAVLAAERPDLVGGDSAGGQLAAVLSREVSGLRGQLLAYPAVDGAGSHPSRGQFATGYGLSWADMDWYWSCWAGTLPRTDPRVSPLHAGDLAGAPPAVVVVAECDVLRDEGRAYAERLAAAGVPVTTWQEDGLPHGFLLMGGPVAAADRAVTRLARAATALLSP